jgi:hypothetical protein
MTTSLCHSEMIDDLDYSPLQYDGYLRKTDSLAKSLV